MAKELIPFKEDENLIVGKYYNVNCAIISYLFNEKKVIKKVPVIGFFHSDKEIGTLHKHIPLYTPYNTSQSSNPALPQPSPGSTYTARLSGRIGAGGCRSYF